MTEKVTVEPWTLPSLISSTLSRRPATEPVSLPPSAFRLNVSSREPFWPSRLPFHLPSTSAARAPTKTTNAIMRIAVHFIAPPFGGGIISGHDQLRHSHKD